MARLDRQEKDELIRKILAQRNRMRHNINHSVQFNDREVYRFNSSRVLENQLAQLKAIERRDLIRFRERWSNWTLSFVGLIVFSNVLIVFLMGFGILRFENQNIIPYFVGDSVIKTIGLAYIIVHFLFSKDSMDDGKK